MAAGEMPGASYVCVSDVACWTHRTPLGRGRNRTTTQPVVRTSRGWTLHCAPLSDVSVNESSLPIRIDQPHL